VSIAAREIQYRLVVPMNLLSHCEQLNTSKLTRFGTMVASKYSSAFAE
jgi:hypothetical protein